MEIRKLVTEHLKAVGAEVGGTLEAALNRFVDWVEGKDQATAAAVAFLESEGYQVTAPVAPKAD